MHRRGGKDKTCINICAAASCERVGTYLYLFPQHNQARRVIWNGIDGNGMRFIDHFPKELIKKVNNTDMAITVRNGSVFQLAGSDNFNALMGTNPVGIVSSEFPLHHPMARQLLSPILAENGGWEILQGTPRGRNHAHDVYEKVRYEKDWFVKTLTVEDTFKNDGTRVISADDIDAERRSGMSEELIQQEFYCSWSVGNVGAFYTQEIECAEREDRIGLFPIARTPCWVFIDIGILDATSIWVVQPSGQYLDLVYYYENTGQGLEHYVDILGSIKQELGIQYEAYYAPHDIRTRDWVSARSRIQVARELGIPFQVVPNVPIEDGIQAVKSLFPKLRFHVQHTKVGISMLREYRREYDEVLRTFKSKPRHDFSSHAADSFRYFCVTWRDLFGDRESKMPRRYSVTTQGDLHLPKRPTLQPNENCFRS